MRNIKNREYFREFKTRTEAINYMKNKTEKLTKKGFNINQNNITSKLGKEITPCSGRFEIVYEVKIQARKKG